MTVVDQAVVLDVERRIMNEFAPVYDVAPVGNSYVYRLERRDFAGWVANTVRDAGCAPSDLSVLDTGCATGGMLRNLEREGFVELTGLDLAENMLAEATRRGPSGAHWVRGTVEGTPFRPASFDVVVACFTIHHLHDPSTFFRLLDHVLRPGGWFFALEYEGGSSLSDRSRRGPRRQLGDVARGAFAFKNRRGLAALPDLEPRFNPAHRLLSYAEIVDLIPDPERYELHRVRRGPLRSTLLPVLIEDSALDRVVARTTAAVDEWFAGRVSGLFQWVSGRRLS